MLRVEGLQRDVGGFRLCVDEWRVRKGEYLVLVGPSGAGKTMLLETIAGLNLPDTGRIWIDGVEATHFPPETRGIGFVYQDCWLFPHMTIRGNINFARRYHRRRVGPPAPNADDLADLLHIGDLLDRKPATLSGGERQRATLARALAIRPRLLFLDEPLGMLDPPTRELVAGELRNCHRAFNMTTVHVTHDHNEARILGDSTAVILGGRIQQTGPTDEIFRKPATSPLARFLGCENLLVVDTIPGAAPHTAKITLGNGSFVVQSEASGRAVLCVRPEDVQVDRHDAVPMESTAVSSLVGRVREVSSRGALVRLLIEAEGHAWVSLVSRSQQRARRFTEGDTVRLTLTSEALHLIPSEP
jgi:molybdate transport system ATP-binding protein